MNQQKKEVIMGQLNKVLAQEGMDLKQLQMIMKDKGFHDEKTQGILKSAGLTLSQNEYNEIFEEINGAINERVNKAVEKKQEEEKAKQPPSFEELRKKQMEANASVVTNDRDLLSKVRQGSLSNADYTPSSGGASFTSSPMPDEPPAEEVELPSKGRFYEGIIREKGGKILLRPMTLKEEKIFTTERLLRTGQAFDMVFRNCIKTPGIDTTQLLSSDRVFLLFYLRAISYGPEYEVKLKCASCGFDNSIKIFINELEITHPPEELEEPYTVTLPNAKKTLVMKLARGKDETRMIRYLNAPKSADEVNNVFIDRLINLIVDIEGIPRERWDSFLNNLIGRDVSHLRKTLELIDFGYKTSQVVDCERCSASLNVDLVINENFFRAN